jgi:hypothetical protein
MKSVIAVAGVVVFVSGVFAQDVLSTWGRSKSITINTSATGANITENVTNFPLLVRLDSTQAEIFTQSKATGADIRFNRPGAGNLPYKIDSWDSAGRKAAIWVLVDTVFGNRASQVINVYWQKSTATATSNGAAVFDADKGFMQVWAMGGAAGPRANSVTGGVTARPLTTVVDSTFTGRSVPGVVGMADSLRGGAATGGEYFDVGPLPSFVNTGFTFSAWSYIGAGAGAWFRVFDFGNGEASDNIFLARNASTTNWMFDVFASQDAFANGSYVTGQWKHLTTTIGQFSDVAGGYPMEIFVDGISAGTGLAASLNDVERSSCFLGKSNWATDTYYPGKLDEVHISKVQRSASWVKLSFESQKTTANLLTFGTSGPPVAIAPRGQSAQAVQGTKALRILRQGTGFTFELPAAESELSVTVTDMWGRAVWSTRTGKQDRAVAWNGKAASGAPLARGMYLARVAPAPGAKAGQVWEGKIAFTK